MALQPKMSFTQRNDIELHLLLSPFSLSAHSLLSFSFLCLSKPKNQRSKRALEARAPKLVEPPRHSLLLRGSKSSNPLNGLLRDLHILSQPHSTHLHKKHGDCHPFDDASSVEFLCSKADASLFFLASDSKKRPHNLTFGRLFDYQLLDMLEYGVHADSYKGISEFEGVRQATVRYGSKPLVLFQGEWWERGGDDWAVQRSMWLDWCKGETLDRINLSAIDRVIVLTATEPNTLHFRHYALALKPSTTRLPYVTLDEVGPRLTLSLRRRNQPAADLVKQAMQQPRRTDKTKERKNLTVTAVGDVLGKVHMKRQDLSNVAIAKLKGLKRTRHDREADQAAVGAAEGAGDGEAVVSAEKRRRGVSGAGGFGPNKHLDSSTAVAGNSSGKK